VRVKQIQIENYKLTLSEVDNSFHCKHSSSVPCFRPPNTFNFASRTWWTSQVQLKVPLGQKIYNLKSSISTLWEKSEL